MIKKVLLVRPNTEIKNPSFTPPIGLGLLGRVAKNNNCDIKILDCANLNSSLEQFKKEFAEFNPDIFGIQGYSSDIPFIKSYLQICKKHNPKTICFVGGVGVTGEPVKFFTEIPEIDFGFVGEAENGFDLLLKKIMSNNLSDLQSIENLVFRIDDSVAVNKQVFSDDFWKHGFPLWGQINPKDYPLTPHGAFMKHTPIAQVQISRGCPFSCVFCASFTMNGKKVRYRPLESVMQEIEFLTKELEVKEIHISDDVFTMNRKYVIDFCNELIKRKIDISWTCPNGVRLDSLDKELLLKMKQSGCYVLSVGIESGNNHILKEMKKSLTVETVAEKVSLIKSAGIDVVGFFIIGFPTETKQDILNTIRFAKSLPLDRANFTIYMPLPRTEMYNKLVEEGEIEKIDFSKYGSYAMASYSSKFVSSNELKQLQKKAFREFYFRPKILFNIMRQINSVTHFKELVKRFFVYGGS